MITRKKYKNLPEKKKESRLLINKHKYQSSPKIMLSEISLKIF